MSMYNDFEWKAKGNKEQCEYNSWSVVKYVRKFPRGHWSFLMPGLDKKWFWNLHCQTRRILGSNGREHDFEFLWIRSSNISCLQCL